MQKPRVVVAFVHADVARTNELKKFIAVAGVRE